MIGFSNDSCHPGPMLSLAQLDSLRWIARLGSFRAAAERCKRTQSTISLRIQELEQTLGARLLERDGQGVRLTPAGLEVLPLGMFDDHHQSDAKQRHRPGLALGFAYAFLDEAKGNRGILGPVPSDGGTTDTHNATADVTFKVRGVSIHGAAYWRDGRRDYGNATTTNH